MYSGKFTPALSVDALLDAEQMVPHVERGVKTLLGLAQRTHEGNDLLKEWMQFITFQVANLCMHD